MDFIKTELEGVFIIEPKLFGDNRGYFFESFSYREFCKGTGNPNAPAFVQDNQSRSTYGVVRGLHFQRAPHAQGKLIKVVEGEVLDVALDIRTGSPTFGKHISVRLSAESHRMLFIPRGLAHGFSVLSQTAVLEYKCDDYYAPDYEDGIAWNDPALGIDWMIPAEKVVLSAKDSLRKNLSEKEW